MSGRLNETSFAEVKEQQHSSQSSLAEYSDTGPTYIAVVSEPTGGIEDYVDEVWEPVGMPSWALQKFLSRRSGYRGNSAIDDPHNQAYVDMNLSSIYERHLEKDDDAERLLTEATDRLCAGENLTLVCYEESGERCHRHRLIDEINKRVKERNRRVPV